MGRAAIGSKISVTESLRLHLFEVSRPQPGYDCGKNHNLRFLREFELSRR